MVQAVIESLLRQKIGLDAASIGSRTITRAVERRRVACGLPNLTAYLHHLQTSAQELEALIEAVVVPETWFFRDKEPFVCLNQYIKTEWQSISASILRVLSIPCSTGEEPYSIAMTLLDSGLVPTQFRIDAVDISKQALLKAKQAIYSRKSFRGGSSQVQQRYFKETEKGYEVRPFVRDTVNFINENILKPSFLSEGKYRIIFCRNLLIYLDSAALTQVMQALDYALAPSGLLFVGSAETGQITAKHYTSIAHPAAFAYRKANSVADEVAIHKPPAVKSVTTHTRSKLPPPTQPSQPIHSRSTLETAKQLADRGDLTEAANLCESYLNVNRTNAQAYILLGEIHQELNNHKLAEQFFQKAIYLNPYAYEALVHPALLKEQRGDFAGANVLRARIQRLLNLQQH